MTSHGGGRLDVLVAGAGPTGLTLALSAHDHGARVRIVDRRPDECRHSRAFLVQPRTLEVLRPYGLAEDLVVHAAPARVHLHLHGRCLPVDAGRLRLPGTAFPRFLLVRQGEVELFLRRALRARGVEVEWGTNLHSIRTGDDGVVGVGTRDGCPTRIGSRFLAGCDGTASTVRRAAGISWNGAAYPQKILLADIELDGDLHPGVAHIAIHRRGVLFLLPLGDVARWRVVTAQQPNRSPASGERRFVQQLLDEAQLPADVTEVAWSEWVQIEHRLASRYQSGPIFLAGDAAHTCSPAGGQGMNTGIQDAANLGWKLAYSAAGRTQDVSALLRSYEQERRPVGRHVVSLSDALFRAEAGPDPVSSLVRHAFSRAGAPLVPPLLRAPLLSAPALRVLAQFDRRYRHSPLSIGTAGTGRTMDHWIVTRPAAPGTRIPDDEVTVDGAPRRLQELTATPAVHVLLHRDTRWQAPGRAGHRLRIHRIGSWPGTGIAIVRPDGYVGFRSTTGTAGAVEWLEMIGALPG